MADGLQALDVGRLLAGLRRGLVPGADNSVEFLCNKFSGLVERLKQAEQVEQAERESSVQLEVKLQAEEQQADAERRHLEVATIAAREETKKVESGLAEALQQEAESKKQLASLRAEAEALAQRKRLLDDTCRTERAKLSEANGRLRRQQLSLPQTSEEVRRLQGQLQSLNSRSDAIAAELEGLQQRSAGDEENWAKMKSEMASEEEAREENLGSAAIFREDLDQALSHLALLQEQLAERQVAVQRLRSECQRCTAQRVGIQEETEKKRSWLRDAQKELAGLSETERGLERVHVETTQLRAQLRVEEEEAKHLEATALSRKAELADTEEKLMKQGERLQQVEQQRDQARLQVVSAEEEEARVQAAVEQLRHDQAAGGGLHRNLETELQMLHAEAERLRGELAFLKTDKLEGEQRLQLIMPALLEARRRVKELEGQIQAVQEESSREKDMGERLERETDTCQEKVRALRDENVRLSEQCSELEAQLAQSRDAQVPLTRTSRSRAEARPLSARREASPSKPSVRTPRAARDTPEAHRRKLLSAERAEREEPSSGAGPSDGPSKLQYLTNWIRNEEGRLAADGNLMQ